MKNEPTEIYAYMIGYTLHDVVENKDIDKGSVAIAVGKDESYSGKVEEEVKLRNLDKLPDNVDLLNPLSRYRLYMEVKHVSVKQ